MKIITLGNGYVASHLPYEIANYRLTPNEEDIGFFLDEYEPDVVVNATGFCGRPNVDQCEIEKTKTYMSNVVVPAMLAAECERRSIRMIHIGSGCIYFGDSPYKGEKSNVFDPGWRETDIANPKSYYSKTKYACDLMIGDMPNVTTLRIRMPISSQNNQRNFINKIRGYSKVIDIPNSVTFMDDFIRCVDWSIKENKIGIFHVTNPEPISAAQTMREYQKYVPDHKFEIFSEKDLDSITTAKRSNCILNTNKLTESGFLMTPSKDALELCMSQYIKNI